MLSSKFFTSIFVTKTDARLQLYFVAWLIFHLDFYKLEFIWTILVLSQHVGGMIPQSWRTACPYLNQANIFEHCAVTGYEYLSLLRSYVGCIMSRSCIAHAVPWTPYCGNKGLIKTQYGPLTEMVYLLLFFTAHLLDTKNWDVSYQVILQTYNSAWLDFRKLSFNIYSVSIFALLISYLLSKFTL